MDSTHHMTTPDGGSQGRERWLVDGWHAPRPGIALAILRPIAALGRVLRARRRRRAGLDMLARMSPHLLADIGLRRSDLDAVMAGVVPIEQIGESAPAGSRPGLVMLPGGRGACDGPRDLDAAA